MPFRAADASPVRQLNSGTAGLLVVNLISRPRVQRTGPIPLWLFSGGLLGAAIVLAGVALVRFS